MQDAMQLAKSIESDIVKWRRDLHVIPEVGNDLPQTSKYVQERLKEMGIPFKLMVNGNGIAALIEGGKPGKTVALRADMDALPVEELAPVDFKSTNGNMHACGHDSHTAMLLGAAKILSENKAELKGNVRLIFQPGEESPGGAVPMINEGVLKNPDVDAAFGLHIGCLIPGTKTGQVIVSHGNAMASRDNFRIVINGKGAHSSTPHLSIDPVMVAAEVINGVYMIKARELDALSPAVLSICTIHGGTADNIIPETVVLEGTTRSIDAGIRAYIEKRIEEVTKHICESFGATYEYFYKRDYDILANDPAMADMVIAAAKKIMPESDIVEQQGAIMGSEDMSFYINEVPGAFFFLASVVEQDGVVYGHHNPKFTLDESAFVRGTAMFLQLVEDYLGA